MNIWVDVKKQLPPEKRYVLAYIPERQMSFMAYWDFENGWNSPFNEIKYCEVVAWAFLPEYPTAENTEQKQLIEKLSTALGICLDGPISYPQYTQFKELLTKAKAHA